MNDTELCTSIQKSLALLTVAEKIKLLRLLRTAQGTEYSSMPAASFPE